MDGKDDYLLRFTKDRAYEEMCKLSQIVSDIYVKTHSVTTIIYVLAFVNALTCIAVWTLIIMLISTNAR